MPSLIFSPASLRDLDRVRAFLHTKKTAVARRALENILTGLKNPEHHPAMGRQVEDRSAEYRELVIPFGRDGYIAAYRSTGEVLMVLGVWHQRENRQRPDL